MLVYQRVNHWRITQPVKNIWFCVSPISWPTNQKTTNPLVVGFEGVKLVIQRYLPVGGHDSSLRFASPWKGVTNESPSQKGHLRRIARFFFLFFKDSEFGFPKKDSAFNLEMHKRDQERILNLNLRFGRIRRTFRHMPCRNVLNLGFLMVPPLVRRSQRSEQESTLTLTCWKVLLFKEIHPLHTFDAVQQFQKSKTLFGVPSYLILFFFWWHFLSTSRGQSMVNRWLSGY